MKAGKKTIVFAGSAGVGKTELAKKYRNVLDLESSRFRFGYEGLTECEIEKLKGAAGRVERAEFPENYIEAIKENLGKYDFICVTCSLEYAVPYYIKNKIDFIFVFPSPKAAESYYDMFIKRGNSEDFARRVYKDYDKYLPMYTALGKPFILLETGETLEDYILKNRDKFPRLVI